MTTFIFSNSFVGYASTGCLLEDISGKWVGNDGGTYYIKQDGDRVWWIGFSELKQGTAFSNVFKGQKNFDIISGKWVDIPMGKNLGNGDITLVCNYISGGDDTLKVESSTGGFGGTLMSKPGTSYLTVNIQLNGFGPNDKKPTLCLSTFIPPSIGFVDASPYCVEMSSGSTVKFALKTPGFVDYDIEGISGFTSGGKSCLGYIYPEQSRTCTISVTK